MMSGYTEEAVASQLTDCGPGMTAFLQKPFLAEDLMDLLRRVVEVATSDR
jgi:FixJ family two-component response regulator